MKFFSAHRIVLLIIGVLVCLGATSFVLLQATHGIITYEVKVNMHRNLPPDRQEMKNMVPEFRTSMHELYFNATESLYKAVADEEEDFEAQSGGMRIKMRQPKVEIYTNSEMLKRITQQDFMGKDYLIEDTLKIHPWKFGTELKMIIGKECKRAFFYDSARKQNVVAWYTFQLRPSMGPEVFSSLPGTVLELDINDGERVVTAKSIDNRALKKNELKPPVKGTKISQPEFRKMVEAQMERMRENGGMIIRN